MTRVDIITDMDTATKTLLDFDHLPITAIRKRFDGFISNRLPRHWLDGWLLAVLEKPVSFFITDGDYVFNDEQLARFKQGVLQMMAGRPLAYLLGMQGFWGRDFVVNQHTLIPRADTEILIDTVLDFIKQQAIKHNQALDQSSDADQCDFAKPHILDLGTGTGCIGITLALQLPKSTVLASDFSAQALSVARQNANRLQANNCAFVESDWYQNITGRFDVIVSNPPYIAPDDEHLSGLMYEPYSALVAKNNGLSDIFHIINGGKSHLKSGGLIVIEHGYDQGVSVRLAYQQAGFVDVQTIKDFGGNERITLGRWRHLG